MKDFQEQTSAFSKIHIELNFPEVDANFQDPSFFELIYNRSVRNYCMKLEILRVLLVSMLQYRSTHCHGNPFGEASVLQ